MSSQAAKESDKVKVWGEENGLVYTEFEYFEEKNYIKGSMGSDTALANIYLLSEKYDILIAEQHGILFRYYRGKNQNRRGYGFPLADREFNLKEAFFS